MRTLFAKCFVGFLFLVFIAVSISFATVLLQTYREYRYMQSREDDMRVELDALRLNQERQEVYLRRMLEDPAFLERIVREKLGYVEADETIFLFEEVSTPPAR
jgi:cell division protein FtsB|tara:strand:- start:1090 stop:1398 length:309 start_codon:yes stop_codon:yes gene_type:complete